MIRTLEIIAVICLMATPSDILPDVAPQGTGLLAEFGIEVVDGRFEVEYLFAIEKDVLFMIDGTRLIGGKNNDFLASLMYYKTQHPEQSSAMKDFSGAIKWLKSNEPSPFPVNGDVIILLSLPVPIFPAGKNAFYFIKSNINTDYDGRMDALFKVTGPFQPASVPDWGVQ